MIQIRLWKNWEYVAQRQQKDLLLLYYRHTRRFTAGVTVLHYVEQDLLWRVHTSYQTTLFSWNLWWGWFEWDWTNIDCVTSAFGISSLNKLRRAAVTGEHEHCLAPAMIRSSATVAHQLTLWVTKPPVSWLGCTLVNLHRAAEALVRKMALW